MKRPALFVSCIAALAILESGCYTAPAPYVAVQAPAPIPPATGYVTYAPEYYTWDGSEYIGVAGGQYVYWDGSVWLAAPPVVLGRFHGWERHHGDWRRHAIPYRRGHEPFRHR